METLVYLAGGELVFEHGEGMARRAVGPGDVLYEAPSELHQVRNEGTVDALALLAVIDRRRGRARLVSAAGTPTSRRCAGGRGDGQRDRRHPALVPRGARATSAP